MRKSLPMLAAVAATLLVPAPAAANVTAEPSQVMQVMRKAGYAVELKTEDGLSYIMSSFGKDGYKFNVLFYGCDEKTSRNCKSVQFYAAFNPKTKPTLDALNEYAKMHRWGRVYRDKENDPVIEMDIDLEKGGMSDALFLDNLEYFEAVAHKFAEFAFKGN